MNKLVEWLRLYADRRAVIDVSRLSEAADEIERLRFALEEIIIHCDWPDRVEKYARAALEGK